MKYSYIFILTFFYIISAFSQSSYHRIWGVKENRKVESNWIYGISIYDGIVYYIDSGEDNKINTLQLPESTTQTFIEIGSPETTQIYNKHRAEDGSWYIGGRTSETENFTTPGAYRTEFDFDQNPTASFPINGFLAKYSANGQLQWCTYTDFFYGSEGYTGSTITTDADNNVYFISYKNNDEVIENAPFQSTANPEDFILGTNKNSTITKLDSDGIYQWGTFFGMHHTAIRSIKATPDGIIVTGLVISTESFSGIPVSDFNYFSTEEAYQTAPNTNVNGEFLTSGFVNKFNFDGTRVWGTYYDESIRTMEVFENEIYIIQVHGSASLENEATEGVFIDEPTDNYVGVLGRLSSDGSELLWKTYLFNDVFEPGLHIDDVRIANINSDGNIWLFGQTNSTTGVATDDAYQTEKNMVTTNNNDSYHLLLSNDGSTVLYSSYYGFEGNDASLAIFPAENGYYSVEQTSGNSNPENFITQGNLLEPDEEGSSTYGGLVYTYFSTEPVSSGTFDKKKITIYPNPAENILHITGEIEDFTKIEIYNMQGQRVFQQPINASEIVSVDINSLVSGVYLLTISNTTDKQTYRIMKK